MIQRHRQMGNVPYLTPEFESFGLANVNRPSPFLQDYVSLESLISCSKSQGCGGRKLHQQTECQNVVRCTGGGAWSA